MKFDIAWIPQIIQIIPMVVSGVEALTKDKKPAELDKDVWNKHRQDAAVSSMGKMVTSLEIEYGQEIMNNSEFQVLLRKLIDDYIALDNFAKKFKEKS